MFAKKYNFMQILFKKAKLRINEFFLDTHFSENFYSLIINYNTLVKISFQYF